MVHMMGNTSVWKKVKRFLLLRKVPLFAFSLVQSVFFFFPASLSAGLEHKYFVS